MVSVPVVGNVRDLRSRALRAFGVFGILVAALFAASSPARADAPVVILYAPDGGEVLAGGSVFTITWNMTHRTDPILFTQLDLSTDGGATFLPITSGDFPANYATYDWTVPAIDTNTARVRVCATGSDGNQSCDVSNGAFVIDSTPPHIVYTVPPNGANGVPLDQPIIIQFSEAIDPKSFYFIFSPSMAFNEVWPNATVVYLYHNVSFMSCTSYTFQVYASDTAGNPLEQGPAPNPTTFTTVCTGPIIVSTDPFDGQADVTLDASIVVRFSDQMDRNSLNVSIDPPITLNASWPPTGDSSQVTLVHTVPFSPCTTWTIRIWAIDQQGNPLVPGQVPNPWRFVTGCGADPFILSTSPADGTTAVSLTTDVVVTFSQAMNKTSVNWAISPYVRLVPGWITDSELKLEPRSKTVLRNVSANPDYYPGGISFGEWMCRQVPPNQIVLPPVGVITSWWVDVHITSPNPGDDHDLGIWLDANNNGVCDAAADMLLCQGADGDADEQCVVETQDGTKSIFVQVGIFHGGSDTFHADIVQGWSLQPCAQHTVDITSGTDLNGNPLVPGTAPNPWSFTTDYCGIPYVVSTVPADAAAEVPRDENVVITFSETMNQSSVSVAFSPTVGNVSYSWSTASVVVRHDLFAPCTNYTVQVTGQDPDGNALNPGPVPNPWMFEADCLAAFVSVTVASPAGGESWTGGSGHTVSFEIANQGTRTRTFDVFGTYRSSAGSGAVGTQRMTVPGGMRVGSQFPWTVPLLDATDVVVNVTAVDSLNDTISDESNPFEVDSTAPQVLSATPDGPHAPLDPQVVVLFSEPMAIGPATPSPLSIVPTVAMAFSIAPGRDAIVADLFGTQPCTTYAVTVAALRDDSDPGNPLAPFTWTFTTECVPTVDLLGPDGGEDWTGGTVHTIRWAADDGDDPTLAAELRYSTDGGASYPNVIASLVVSLGAASFDWMLPKIDFATVRVQVVVTDGAGNTARDASVASFTIDSTPPARLASFPSPGSGGHKTTRQMYFVFTEPVDRASFEAAFVLSPSVGGIVKTWSRSNLDTDVLTIDHDPLKAHTEYTVTFLTYAKDDSDPGNHLAAPMLVRFTTNPPPNVSPPVAKAVGKNQVQAGDVVTLDASQSTGDITQYVWRINDNQDRFVAVLVGESVPIAFREHGRYHVTLIVTDSNGLTGEDTIEIAVTSNPNGVLILSGVLLLSAALVGATEAGRAGVFSFILFPMYVRRKRNEVLEHQTRGMILGYILVHPGDSYTDIKRNLVLSNGTLTYHLTVLEREGIVRSQTRGPRKLFYPLSVRVPEDGGGLHEIQVRMFRAIREVPGLAVKDIAGALGITSQHALYHLRALAAQGFVRLERRGLHIRCFAEPGKGPPLHPPETP